MINKLLKAIKENCLNYKKLNWLYSELWNDYKSPKVNLGQIQSISNNEKKISRLSDVEFQVFSQFGDDGIIQWLVNKLQIPNKTFIEFGVENYREANTRFLLINNYWSGLIIDGSKNNIDSIKGEQIYTFYDLQAENSFITKSNINDLIETARFKKDIGILSIDIDGNDYWVWKEIINVNPVIVICEYNGLFGFEHTYTIEYKDDFVRGVNCPFNFYGASLSSLCDIGKSKGYGFVGCNSAGNNAYFIRIDFLKNLPIPELTAEQGYVFPNFTESKDEQGFFLRGLDKVKTLNGLPVINTRTGDKEKVDSSAIIRSLISSNKSTRG